MRPVTKINKEKEEEESIIELYEESEDVLSHESDTISDENIDHEKQMLEGKEGDSIDKLA